MHSSMCGVHQREQKLLSEHGSWRDHTHIDRPEEIREKGEVHAGGGCEIRTDKMNAPDMPDSS